MTSARHESMLLAALLVSALSTGCDQDSGIDGDSATDTMTDTTVDGTGDPDAVTDPVASDTTEVPDVPTDVVYDPPSGTWVVSVGGFEYDEASAALPSDTGGALIAGKVYIGHMDHPDINPMWLAEIGTTGSLLWQVQFGIYEDDYIRSIASTPAGGVILVGTASVVEEGEGFYSYDALSMHVDAAGDVQWAHTHGNDDDDSLDAVIPTADGTFVAVGFISEFSGSRTWGWITKFDVDGAILWQKYLQADSDVKLHAVAEISGGDLLVLGESSTDLYGTADLLMIRITSEGAVVWQKTLGGDSTDEGHALTPTADGGLVAVGATSSAGPALRNALVVKLDGDGALLWQLVVGAEGNDIATSVLEHTDATLRVAGETSSFTPMFDSQTWILGITQTGDVVSQTSLGVAEYNDMYTMLAGFDGTHLMHVASTSSNAGDILVSRTGPEGAVQGCSMVAATAASAMDPGWSVVDSTLLVTDSFLGSTTETVHLWASDLPAAPLCPE